MKNKTVCAKHGMDNYPMRKQKPAHTPTLVLPLQVVDNGAGVKYLCDSSNGEGAGREIATLTGHLDGIHNADLKIEDELNAAFIVRAVNSYEKLLLAAKGYRQYLALDGRSTSELDALIAQAEQSSNPRSGEEK